MKLKISKPIRLGTLLFLLSSYHPLAGQQPPTDPASAAGQQGQGAAQQQNPPQNLQSISQTGLLPVYGVDARLDPSWVDGSQFPSQSTNFPNSGTSAAFQQVWGALQPGGYSVLRVPLDVRDSTGSANRAANLCVWAKSNNVQLIFLLTGEASGQPIGADFPKRASDFLKAFVALMRGNNGQYLANYTQIMAYQINDEINHPGHHGGMVESAAQQLALAAAKSVRSSELDALNGSGLSATPLMTSVSFDSYLISAGAIAGGTMTDAAYTKAYQSLKLYLSGLSGSADLDLLLVDWFAGSVGGGGVEKIPDMLKSLITDVPGKQLVLGTGFSTAFRSADEQKRLFTTAFANLGDLRASIGTNCPFVGTIFHEALNGSTPNPDAPRTTLPGEMDKWDWPAKAAELTAMWTKKKKSADMAWWLTRVENNMGLVTLQSDSSGNVVAANALPAQQAMNQIAGAVSDANSQMATSAPASPYGNSFVPPANAPANPPANPSTDPYGQQMQQQSQPTSQAPGMAVDPYAAAASNVGNQAQQYPANSYSGAATNAYQQPGCAPNYQGQQQNTGLNAQQPYGQQTAAGCSPTATGNGLGQGFQAIAQQGMMGLLNIALQRLSGAASGAGGNTFNGSGNNSFNNNLNGANNINSPGSPYNYYNSTANSGQPSGYPSSNSVSPQQGGAGPVMVQIGPQDLSIQPANPQVGTSATINVNVHNQGSADVYGLVVQAGGSDGATLSQQASVHVAPNSSSPVQLQWTPSSAAQSYSVTVSVSDGSGNPLTTAQFGPVTVSGPPNSNNANNNTNNNTGSGGGSTGGTGTTNITGTGGTSAGGSTGGTDTTNTTGTGGTSAGGSTGGTDTTNTTGTGGTGSTGGTDPTCGTGVAAISGTTTGTNPSSSATANCGSVNSNGVATGGATGSAGGSTKVTNPLGSVKLTAIQVGVPGQTVATGQPSSVLVPLLNPYLVPMSNIKASLVVDGQTVQTQSMTTLLPQQSHSLVFQGISFAQAGKHQVSVSVDSQRPGADPMTSTMVRSINVADPKSMTNAGTGASPGADSSSQPGTTSTSGGATSLGTTPASGRSPSTAPTAGAPVRSVTAQTFQIGRTTLPAGPGSLPASQTASYGGNNTSTSAATSPAPSAPGAAGVSGGATPNTRAVGPRSIVGLPPRQNPGPATGTQNAMGNTGQPASANVPSGATRPSSGTASSPMTATPPPTPAPVRAIGAGGTGPTTPSSIAVPVRPGPGGVTGTTAATGTNSPQPTTGAPIGAPIRPGPIGAPTPTTATGPNFPVRPGPAGTTTASNTPNPSFPARPGPTTPAGAASMPTTPARNGVSPVAPQGNLDLSVLTPDIRLNPTAPRQGQTTTFTAVIRNMGTLGAQGASVTFSLVVDGRQVAISSPVTFSIAGHGAFLASWSTTMPVGRQMQVVVTAIANGDVNPANNRAILSFTGAPK